MNSPAISKARYIRVSYKDQNNARQLAKQHPDEQLFIDVISGAVDFAKRPAAKQMLAQVIIQDIKQISVSSIDRLGRNAFDIQQTLEVFRKRDVNLKVDNLGIESIAQGKPNQIFKMIVDVLANVAQMEREAIRERQAEGIIDAKKRGAYAGVGRKKGSVDSPAEIVAKYKSV